MTDERKQDRQPDEHKIELGDLEPAADATAGSDMKIRDASLARGFTSIKVPSIDHEFSTME